METVPLSGLLLPGKHAHPAQNPLCKIQYGLVVRTPGSEVDS